MDLDALAPLRVCISLDRRPDRWRRMRRRLARLGLHSVVRFPAVDGAREERPASWADRPGAYGCMRSHLEVVEAARRAGAPGVLVLEDDAELAADWKARLDAAVPYLPDDWDLLYLGCNHREPPVPLAGGLARVVQAHSTFAYLLRATGYRAFLDVNRSADRPIDLNLLRLQRERPCHALWPNAAWVEEDFSDIQGRYQSYWYLRESVMVTTGALGGLPGRSLMVLPVDAAGWRAAPAEHLAFVIESSREALPGLDVVIGAERPAGRRAGAVLAALDDLEPPPVARRLAGWPAGAPASGADLRGLADDLGGRYQLVLGAGAPVHFPGRLLSAAVQMALRFDLVLPFRSARPLSPAQTRKFLDGGGNGYDPTLCPGRGRSARQLGWWVANLDAAASSRPLSTFQAPALALRLATPGPGATADRHASNP